MRMRNLDLLKFCFSHQRSIWSFWQEGKYGIMWRPTWWVFGMIV
jgi:hypothetical protein